MTGFGSQIAALLAAGAAAAGGLIADDSGSDAASAPRTALVIDAAAARDGRALVDPRLQHVDAEVRLPRTSTEARTNVRYFAAQDYRVVTAGPRANAAAELAGAQAVRSADLTAALATVGR